MLLRLYNVYQTGKFIYSKILKPVYEELKKDAYASEPVAKEQLTRKIKTNKRKANKKNQ